MRYVPLGKYTTAGVVVADSYLMSVSPAPPYVSVDGSEEQRYHIHILHHNDPQP